MSGVKRIGPQTVELPSKPTITATASIVGEKEGKGPLGEYYDLILDDDLYGESSWEKAESKIMRETVEKAINKAQIATSDINYMFAGDLLNQSIATTFGVKELEIPLYGIFGACSTMAESLSLASMMVDGGFSEHTLAVTSSHFCSAERQFRFPLEYGNQRTPTSSWTVTGSGAALVSTLGEGPFITHITTGKVVDWCIKDANNMGAAMAPAAADTILAHLKDTNRMPGFYDLIVTGDLGIFGKQLCEDILLENNISLGNAYNDCGIMMFDCDSQEVEAGGSGCGCSAAVLCGYIMQLLKNQTINNVLFISTGALMSKTSSQQSESIPGIAHAVAITNYKE